MAWIVAILCLSASAVSFPLTGAAGVSLLLMVAALGALFAWSGRDVSVALPRWAADASMVGVVLAGALPLFVGPWMTGGLGLYDWGPHHANLRHLVDGLKQGAVPDWVHGVSTGDSPYELYPILPYYLMAKIAIVTGADDLTLVMARTAIATHTLAALGGTLLARRLLSRPFAVLVGLVMLYDNGSAWGGGMDGLFYLGVVHSAMANAAWPFALASVLDAVSRPRLFASIRIWLFVALSISCHPLGLLSALATSAGLVVVALVALDVPRHRALFALGHVAIGVLASAFVWMPLSANLLNYGVHFGAGGQLAWEAFGHLLTASIPECTVGPLIFAGYVGMVVGLMSRSAARTLVACHAAVLFAGLFDQLYVLLDLVPSLESSRFQSVRLAPGDHVPRPRHRGRPRCAHRACRRCRAGTGPRVIGMGAIAVAPTPRCGAATDRRCRRVEPTGRRAARTPTLAPDAASGGSGALARQLERRYSA
jgi:hypothetical protein